MISNESIVLIAVLGIVSLCIFLALVLFYSRKQTVKKGLVSVEDDLRALARECALEAGKHLESKMFDWKEWALIAIASAFIAAFSGMNIEFAKAVLAVDGFMISFLIIAWSIIIRQIPTAASDLRYLNEQIQEMLKEQKSVGEITRGKTSLDKEGIRAFFGAIVTPIMQRGIIGKAFKLAIVALMVSVGSSLVLFGFQEETISLLARAVYLGVRDVATTSLLLGIYLIIKTFSLNEDVLFENETKAFAMALKQLLESVPTEEKKKD